MPRLTTKIARDIWWLFLLVIIAHTALVALNIWRQSRDEDLVSRSMHVSNVIRRLRIACTDMHLELRGYIISNDRKFITQFHGAENRVEGSYHELRALNAANPKQQEIMDRIAILLTQQREYLQRLADLQASDRTTEGFRAEFRQRNELTNQIRAELTSMQDEESAQLALREASSRSTIVSSIWTAIVGGALVIGMLILARHFMHREFETRQRSEAAIRLSNERFGALAKSLPQIVWVSGPDGAVEFFNPRWFTYTGLPDRDGGGGFGQALHPDDHDPALEQWAKAVTTGNTYEGEFRLRRYDGIYHWFLGRALPLRDSNGRIIQWFGTCTNINDQKRSAEELETRVQERTAELQLTTAELTRSNKELEQFAYVASHDLQEPLRKIQAFSDRLIGKYGTMLEGQGKEYVDRMQNAARRMRQLIDDLLTYSRVSTRSRTAENVDLNLVARDVLDDLEETVVRTNAQVDVGPLPTIRADAVQMRQLFQNLIGNALKFAKPGTSARLAIRADATDNVPGDHAIARKSVRLTFTDDGIGFDPAYSSRIFQVFQRLHGRDEYEGTGIGLAIVRRIVERHGGEISAASSLGNGACFTVVLPLQLDVGAAEAPSSDTFKKGPGDS